MAEDGTAVVAEADRGQWTTEILRRAATKVGRDTRGTALGLSPGQRLDLRVTAVEERERTIEETLTARVDKTEEDIANLKTVTLTLCGLLAESAELLGQLLAGDPKAPAAAAAYLLYMQDRAVQVGFSV